MLLQDRELLPSISISLDGPPLTHLIVVSTSVRALWTIRWHQADSDRQCTKDKRHSICSLRGYIRCMSVLLTLLVMFADGLCLTLAGQECIRQLERFPSARSVFSWWVQSFRTHAVFECVLTRYRHPGCSAISCYIENRRQSRPGEARSGTRGKEEGFRCVNFTVTKIQRKSPLS